MHVDELVKQVAAKAGLDEGKARTAVETVIEQVKDRLPAPLASHLGEFMAGHRSLDDLQEQASHLMSNFSGLFGR